MSDATRLFNTIDQGNPKGAEELLPLVYDELRKLAAAKMANEAAGHTLQPTALVHEAWLRLVGAEQQTGRTAPTSLPAKPRLAARTLRR